MKSKCSLGALDLPLGKSLLVAFNGHDKIVWLALNEGSPVVLEVQSEKSFGGASEKHTAVGASDLAGSTVTRNVAALVFDVGLRKNVSDGFWMEPNQSVAREGSLPVGGECAAVG